MFEAIIDRQGFPAAKCSCDDCGTVVEVKAQHLRVRGKPPEVAEGQTLKKLTSQGWTLVKNRLRCPDCEGKRRAANAKPAKTEEHQQEIRMAKADTVTPLRQPTREQKRQIIELLNEVYDTKAERYRGGETDLTVADTIGGGVMFGWVAQIREELFGPDGGNEEVEVLLAEVKEWKDKADQHMKTMEAALKQAEEAKTGFAECRTKLVSLQGRMEALRKAFGPKVDRLASA